MSPREGSFMVLGFDFMLDENLGVWLIEINTSPSNELSTPVTTKVIDGFQRDQAKLYFDYNIFGKTRNEKAEIGKFRRIYNDGAKKVSIRDKIMAQAKQKSPEGNGDQDQVLL